MRGGDGLDLGSPSLRGDGPGVHPDPRGSEHMAYTPESQLPHKGIVTSVPRCVNSRWGACPPSALAKEPGACELGTTAAWWRHARVLTPGFLLLVLFFWKDEGNLR